MRFLAALLALQSAAALAQGTLEIVPLRHRTAEQVIPVLRPLLEPGGVLSGQSNQLFVRASPANLVEIRAALAAIDTPLRRLLISVRFERSGESERGALEANGSVRAGDVTVGTRAPRGADTHLDLRIQERRTSEGERVDQRVQVLEGGRAFIASGESQPLRQRQVVRTPSGTVISETTTMQEISSGFQVVPRISGGHVLLEIAPQRERRGALPGSVEGQRLATTVSAPLGIWFEIGAAAQSAERDRRGIVSSREARAREERRVWVKVEEVRP